MHYNMFQAFHHRTNGSLWCCIAVITFTRPSSPTIILLGCLKVMGLIQRSYRVSYSDHTVDVLFNKVERQVHCLIYQLFPRSNRETQIPPGTSCGNTLYKSRSHDVIPPPLSYSKMPRVNDCLISACFNFSQ